MPYAALPTKSAGGVVTLSDYNTIRNDFMVGTPDIFTAKGDLAVAAEAEAATRLAVGSDDDTLTPDATQLGGLSWQIQPAARVYNSGDLTSGTLSWETLTFDSERFDTNGMHDSLVSSRLTVPTGGDGLYLLGATVKFQPAGYTGFGSDYRGMISLRILLNGTSIIARNGTYFVVALSAISGVCDIISLYHLVAGDYVQLQRYASGSFPYGALNATAYSPEFWAIWQRRA